MRFGGGMTEKSMSGFFMEFTLIYRLIIVDGVFVLHSTNAGALTYPKVFDYLNDFACCRTYESRFTEFLGLPETLFVRKGDSLKSLQSNISIC